MAGSFWIQDGKFVIGDGVFCIDDECPCTPPCDYFIDDVSELAKWTVEDGTWSEV